MLLARNTLLGAIFDRAAEHGLHRDAILADIELEPALADQPGTFISAAKLIDAVEFAALATKANDFGLSLGSKQDHRALGPVGLLAEHCHSVAETVAEGSRYLHLHNAALNYTTTLDANRYVFRLQLRTRGKYLPRHYVEALLMMCLRFCQLLLKPNWAPLAVLFEHDRIAPRQTYCRYFGTQDIRFGQSMNALLAPKADFERPIKSADPRMKALVQKLLDELDRQHTKDLPAQVTALLRPLLHTGKASARKAAAILSLSARTLQRRLAAHGTSFNEVLRDTRIQLVKDYLTREGMTVTQMAQVLGFAEVSGVSRFLRTHFGQSAKSIKLDARPTTLDRKRTRKRVQTGFAKPIAGPLSARE